MDGVQDKINSLEAFIKVNIPTLTGLYVKVLTHFHSTFISSSRHYKFKYLAKTFLTHTYTQQQFQYKKFDAHSCERYSNMA